MTAIFEVARMVFEAVAALFLVWCVFCVVGIVWNCR